MGLLNVAVYAVVFFDAKLYADMGLQGIYFALCLYGWWAWLRGGAAHGRLVVSRAPRAVLAACALAGVVFAAAIGIFLHAKTDAALPYWDGFIFAGSVASQWLQARKALENWIGWIVVNSIAIGVYWAKDLYWFAVLYFLFWLMAWGGLRAWRRSGGTAHD